MIDKVQKEGAVSAVYNGTARKALLAYAEENYVAYTQRYVLGAVFRGGELEAWFNPYAILSKILAYDLASSALLAYRTEDSTARFQTTVAVHVPEATRHDRPFVARAGSGEENPLSDLHVLVHDMAHAWAVLAPLALAAAVAAFVPFASSESCSGYMQLQLMTGIPGWLHCLANIVFDAIGFAWMELAVSVLFKSYYQLESASYDALLVHCVTFGALAIMSAYLIAYWSSTADSAYVTVLLVFGIGGGFLVESTVLLLTEGQDPSFLCSVLPPCAVPMAALKVIVLEWVHHTCDDMAATKLENSTALSAFCRDSADALGTFQPVVFAGLLKAPVEMCCAGLHPKYVPDWSPLQLSAAGTGLELRFMILVALLLFVLLCCYRSGRFLSSSTVGPLAEQMPLDTEVVKEARQVHNACERNALEDRALVVEDVHKWYEDDYCVCGFSLALAQDECFGLLGVHGCGKTAVAEILAGLALPSLGECHMGDVKLSDSARNVSATTGAGV
ncbi:phospholipid-transporting ATPase ABCA3-like [Amblyomma americanum]